MQTSQRTKLVSVPHCCPAQSTRLGRTALTAYWKTAWLGDKGATCQVQQIWNMNSGGPGTDKQGENFPSVQSGLREGDSPHWAGERPLSLSGPEQVRGGLPATDTPLLTTELADLFFQKGKNTTCPLTAVWWSVYKTGSRVRKVRVQILTLPLFSWPTSGKLMLGGLSSPICKMGITEVPPAWGWHHYNVPIDFLDFICTYYLQVLAFYLLS